MGRWKGAIARTRITVGSRPRRGGGPGLLGPERTEGVSGPVTHRG